MVIKEMKPMIYGYNKEINGDKALLFTDVYKGVVFVVVNTNGSHPCGYVEVTGTKYDESSEWNQLDLEGKRTFWKSDRPKRTASRKDISVHGGITFNAGWCPGGIHNYDTSDTFNTSRWFIGWDYNHFGDYGCHADRINPGDMYTTEEVIDDCKKVIDQLKGDKNEKV